MLAAPVLAPSAPLARAAAPAALLFQPHPFRAEVEEITVAEGLSCEAFVAATGLPPDLWRFVRVEVGDVAIPRGQWPRVRPKAGATVYVRVRPAGGGGGSGGRKDILASILMLTVSIAASAFAPMLAGAIAPGLFSGGVALGVGGALLQGAVGAGLALLGSLAVMALIPPAKAESNISQRGLLSGVRNRFQPYAPIPRIFGKRRVYPLQGARPYTEAVGDKRWMRVLLVVGWGPLKITDLKIGQTPISAYPNIEVEIREGWESGHTAFGALPSGKSPEGPLTLFTQTVQEEVLALNLPSNGSGGAGAWVQQTTELDTEEIVIDVTASEGLAEISEDGEVKPFTVKVKAEYRAVGAGSWTSVAWAGPDEADGTQTNGVLTLKDETASPIVRGGRWKVAKGQYEVRLRYEEGKAGGGDWAERDLDRVDWTALRSISSEYPVKLPGLCCIALRIKATDSFATLPDTINCVAESYLPGQNEDLSWTWVVRRNPAWAFGDVLRRRGTERMMADAAIDLPALRAWGIASGAAAPNADEPRWQFDAIIEGGSVYSALRQIASHGRASWTMKDGLHSIVRDAPQATPVQHITPRNSWGYSGSRAFIDLPHALKVRFINAAQGYQEDEEVVYMDGYTESNASRFESIELPGCTSSYQAWREGRYYLAVGRLRPDEHSVSQDIENLRATRGSLVMLAHDVISVGVASARIVSRVMAGALVAGFVLDAAVPMAAGQDYAIRARRSTGASVLYALGTAAATTETDTIMLPSAVAASGAPSAGDLVTFGEATRETAPMIVKAIQPGPDFTARLILVDDQPGVHTADTSTIPPFNSHVNDDTPADQQLPAAPGMTVVSNEAALVRTADGGLKERILVRLRSPIAGKLPITKSEVRWRPAATGDWRLASQNPPDVLETAIGEVKQGLAYDLRSRWWTEAGPGPWTQTLGHVVVGKTTAPGSVGGFAAAGRPGGAQLTWGANPEIDVVAYQIRRGTSWNTAAMVNSRVVGTEFFAPHDGAGPQTFLIKAIDVVGLMSATAASAVADIEDYFDAIADELAAITNALQAQVDGLVEDVSLVELRADEDLDEIAEARTESLLYARKEQVGRLADLAYVREESNALITAERVAIASVRLELGAAIDANTASLLRESQVRADATSAFAFDLLELEASTGLAQAYATSQLIVLADEQGAQATAISALEVRAADVEAETSIIQTAVATLEGNAAASIVLRAAAGGGAATIELVAGDDPTGPASSAVRIKGQYVYLDGNSYIANAVITTAAIADLAVETIKIKNEAVTIRRRAYVALDPEITISSKTTWVTLVSKTIPKDSGWGVHIRADVSFAGMGVGTLKMAVFRSASGQSEVNYVKVTKDHYQETGSRGIAASVSWSDYDSNTAGGALTYHLRAAKASTPSGLDYDLVVSDAMIELEEGKK